MNSRNTLNITYGVIRGVSLNTSRSYSSSSVIGLTSSNNKSITTLFNNKNNNNNQKEINISLLNGLSYQFANYAIKQAVGRRVKPNVFVQSPGQVFEKTLPVPLLKTLASPSLWWEQAKYFYRTFGAYTLIKNKLKKLNSEKFVVRGFLEEAKEKYTKLNQTLLSGNIDKDITTVYFHSVLSTQFKVQPKHIKSSWSAQLNKPRVIWSRAGQIQTSMTGDMEFFAQICVEFTGTQSISLVDTKSGNTISEAKDVQFTDVYVFERCLSSLPSEWRICAQVVPSPTTTQ